jgi:hypothetical protein
MEQRRHGGFPVVMTPPCSHGDAARFLGTRERERERERESMMRYGQGEQRSSPKRWGGGGFSAISGDER